jgi:hypothetical protein
MEEISARAWTMKRDIQIFQTTKQLSLRICLNTTITELVLYAATDKNK